MPTNFPQDPTLLNTFKIDSYAALDDNVKDLCASMYDGNPEMTEEEMYEEIIDEHMHGVDFEDLGLDIKVQSSIASFLKRQKRSNAAGNSKGTKSTKPTNRKI